jgi:type IV secretory pathway TrbL component
MDLDIQTVLRWLLIGGLLLVGVGLLGVVLDLASALLRLALRVGVIVLVVLLGIRLLEKLRS